MRILQLPLRRQPSILSTTKKTNTLQRKSIAAVSDLITNVGTTTRLTKTNNNTIILKRFYSIPMMTTSNNLNNTSPTFGVQKIQPQQQQRLVTVASKSSSSSIFSKHHHHHYQHYHHHQQQRQLLPIVSLLLTTTMISMFSTVATAMAINPPNNNDYLSSLSLSSKTVMYSSMQPQTQLEIEEEEDLEEEVIVPPFDESCLAYDHYNGVTLHLDKMINYNNAIEGGSDDDDDDDDKNSSIISMKFVKDLEKALLIWNAEGRKGIWIHVPPFMSHLVPHCINAGFEFHFVKEKTLILSKWLPKDIPSRLPLGPTYQIGVGTVVLHPDDPSLMLVVQEITGPAAARKLWKMPTGLIDPGEDIPDAAIRELYEETGIKANSIDGIICFRQAATGYRTSDLFFICKMNIMNNNNNNNNNSIQFKPQAEEIADIRWMSIDEYCNQETWQRSPVYQSINDAIRRHANAVRAAAAGEPTETTTTTTTTTNKLIGTERLPVGFSDGKNTVYKSHL